jgi:TetR/AcrR family transcriptional regulator
LSESSKDHILQVATRLFARRGYDGTSLQAIAEEVGMRKPSLLYHFASKGALREAVLHQLVAGWKTRFPEVLAAAQGTEDRFHAMFVEASEFFRTDPNRARLLLREMVDRPHETRELVGGAIAPWLQLVVDTLEEGQAQGRVRADVDPLAYIMECITLIVGTFAAADLAAGLSGVGSIEASVDRQFREILRIARVSLFTPEALQHSQPIQTPSQTVAQGGTQ